MVFDEILISIINARLLIGEDVIYTNKHDGKRTNNVWIIYAIIFFFETYQILKLLKRDY